MTKDVGIWMPVYVGDMLANTTRLNTEQIGALNLMMLDYWRSGAIPDDAQVISSITRMTTAKVKKYRSAMLSCGVFEVSEDQWVSPYLDGLRDAATENKKEKFERAIKAAEARWGKKAADAVQSSNASASSEQCTSNAQAMLEQCTSNAQAMLEHTKTDAKTMLEQCPSSSSSSIKNTLSNASEFAPDLKALNDTLKASGAQPVTQEQLDQTLVFFTPHYENHTLTPNQRMVKLAKWIKEDQAKASPRPTKPRPTKPRQTAQQPTYGNVNDHWNNPSPPDLDAHVELTEEYKRAMAKLRVKS